MNGWGKIKSAAQYCDVSERTLRKWLKDGLKHVRVQGSGTILIKYSWLDEFLENFTVNQNHVDEIVSDVLKQLGEGD